MANNSGVAFSLLFSILNGLTDLSITGFIDYMVFIQGDSLPSLQIMVEE